MGTVNNALTMLAYLSTGKTYKIRELARELEVSEKSVRLYRDALDTAGIYVQEQRGRYGGYYIPRECLSPLMGLAISQEEIEALEILEGELTDARHMEAVNLRSLLQKIQAAQDKKRMGEESYAHHVCHLAGGVRPNVEDGAAEREKFLTLIKAKKKGCKVSMLYQPLSGEAEERVVHVYNTYTFQGEMYMAAWCELREAVRDFKVRRARQIRLLDEPYTIPESFSMAEYMKNCIGVFKGKPLDVRIRVREPLAQIIREKIWSENQTISELGGDEGIEFAATMRGEEEIISWILSLGSLAEVLEPAFLRDRVREECRRMLESLDDKAMGTDNPEMKKKKETLAVHGM